MSNLIPDMVANNATPPQNGVVVPIITCKAIRIGLKHAWTTKQFCEKYCIEPEAFERCIRNLFPYSYAEVFKDIHENNRKAAKEECKLNRSKNYQELTDQVQPEAPEATTPIDEPQPAVEAEVEVKPSTTLHELQAQAEILQSEMDQHRASYNRIATDHKENRKLMRELQAQLDALSTHYQTIYDKLSQCLKQDDAYIEDMNNASSQYRNASDQLEEVKSQIEALEKITIYIYNNGEFEIEEGQAIIGSTLNETGSEQIYSTLIADTAYQELRVVDIRSIARAVSIARNYERHLEFMFENESLLPYLQTLLDYH